MPQVDRTTYPKADRYPIGHGYGERPGMPTSLIIHSTNNKNKNTFFTAEAKFLFEAGTVSAHFLVGKDGKIVQFLDPGRYAAFHAGASKPGFANALSIGIELHHSVGDPPYPDAQIAALTWLVRGLIAQWRIPLSLIETHRAVALPKGRKVDPSDWPDADFYRWRAQLDDVSDPLRAKELPGIGKAIYCSEKTEAFYTSHGGLSFFGYPVSDERETVGADGQPCQILPCERAVIKTKLTEAAHQALLKEVFSKGWA